MRPKTGKMKKKLRRETDSRKRKRWKKRTKK
jgi:hypothetical protein